MQTHSFNKQPELRTEVTALDKIYFIIGYGILVFILISNHVPITLPDAGVIALSVVSIILNSAGILIKKRSRNKNNKSGDSL